MEYIKSNVQLTMLSQEALYMHTYAILTAIFQVNLGFLAGCPLIIRGVECVFYVQIALPVANSGKALNVNGHEICFYRRPDTRHATQAAVSVHRQEVSPYLYMYSCCM